MPDPKHRPWQTCLVFMQSENNAIALANLFTIEAAAKRNWLSL
jgi:hypothetical protein